MTAGTFRIEDVSTLAEVPPDAWRRIAPGGNLYQTYEWMRAAEAIAGKGVTYHCAVTPGGDLCGCLPVYGYRPGGNPGYDPMRLYATAEDGRRWYPHALYGARSGYLQRPLADPGLAPEPRRRLLRALIARADAPGRRAASASFPFVAADTATDLSACLPGGWSVRPAGPAAALDVPEDGFDGYLRSFPARRRTMVKREVQALAEQGVTVVEGGLTEYLPLIARLGTGTQQRHGSTIREDRLRAALELQARWLAGRDWVLAAYRGPVCLGVVLSYRCGDTLFPRLVGLDHDEPATRRARVYFNLLFYELVRRSARAGIRRAWLGPGALDAKLRRGCSAFPLVCAVREP